MYSKTEDDIAGTADARLWSRNYSCEVEKSIDCTKRRGLRVDERSDFWSFNDALPGRFSLGWLPLASTTELYATATTYKTTAVGDLRHQHSGLIPDVKVLKRSIAWTLISCFQRRIAVSSS